MAVGSHERTAIVTVVAACTIFITFVVAASDQYASDAHAAPVDTATTTQTSHQRHLLQLEQNYRIDYGKVEDQVSTWRKYYSHRQNFAGRRVGKNFRPYFGDYQESIVLVGFAGFVLSSILVLVGMCYCCNACVKELVRKLTYATFRPRETSIFSNYETLCSQCFVWLLFLLVCCMTGFGWWASIELHDNVDVFIDDSRVVSQGLVDSLTGLRNNYTAVPVPALDLDRLRHLYEISALQAFGDEVHDEHMSFLDRGHEYEMTRYVMLFIEGSLAVIAMMFGVYGIVKRDTRPLYKMGTLAWITAALLWALFAGHQELGVMTSDWCGELEPFVQGQFENRVPFLSDATYSCLDEQVGYSHIVTRRLTWDVTASVKALNDHLVRTGNPGAGHVTVDEAMFISGNLAHAVNETVQIRMKLSAVNESMIASVAAEYRQHVDQVDAVLVNLERMLALRGCSHWREFFKSHYESMCYDFLLYMEYATGAVAAIAVVTTLMICAAPCAINRIPERTDFNQRDVQMATMDPYRVSSKPYRMNSGLPPIVSAVSNDNYPFRDNISAREKQLGGRGFYDLHANFSTHKPGNEVPRMTAREMAREAARNPGNLGPDGVSNARPPPRPEREDPAAIAERNRPVDVHSGYRSSGVRPDPLTSQMTPGPDPNSRAPVDATRDLSHREPQSSPLGRGRAPMSGPRQPRGRRPSDEEDAAPPSLTEAMRVFPTVVTGPRAIPDARRGREPQYESPHSDQVPWNRPTGAGRNYDEDHLARTDSAIDIPPPVTTPGSYSGGTPLRQPPSVTSYKQYDPDVVWSPHPLDDTRGHFTSIRPADDNSIDRHENDRARTRIPAGATDRLVSRIASRQGRQHASPGSDTALGSGDDAMMTPGPSTGSHIPASGTKYSPHTAPIIMKLGAPPIVQDVDDSHTQGNYQ